MAYCTNCGAKLKEGAKFCASCGAPVDDGSKETVVRLTDAQGEVELSAWEEFVPDSAAPTPQFQPSPQRFAAAPPPAAAGPKGKKPAGKKSSGKKSSGKKGKKKEDEEKKGGKFKGCLGWIIFFVVVILIAYLISKHQL